MASVKYLKFQDSPVLVDKAYTAQNAKHAEKATLADNATTAENAKQSQESLHAVRADTATTAENASSVRVVNTLPTIGGGNEKVNYFYTIAPTGSLYLLTEWGNNDSNSISSYQLPISSGKYNRTAVSTGRYIYLFGGYLSQDNRSIDIDRFDTYTKELENVGTYNFGNTGLNGIYYNEKIYLFGKGGNVYIYDINTNTMETVSTGFAHDFYTSAIALSSSGSIYLFGGTPVEETGNIYEWFPISKRMVKLNTTISLDRKLVDGAVSFQDKIFVIYDFSYRIFNPILDSWEGSAKRFSSLFYSNVGGYTSRTFNIVDNCCIFLTDRKLCVFNLETKEETMIAWKREIQNLTSADGGTLFTFGSMWFPGPEYVPSCYQISYKKSTTYVRIQTNLF